MERFRQRLAPAPVSRMLRIPYGLKVAAVLVLVALSSILVYEGARHFYARRQPPIPEILPGDYGEAQVYYTSLIREKYTEIDRLNVSDPEGKDMLMQELSEMDRLFNSLMKDLKTNPSDERILSAMINHYQLKLEVMGRIIEQLETVKQIQTSNDSNDEKEI